MFHSLRSSQSPVQATLPRELLRYCCNGTLIKRVDVGGHQGLTRSVTHSKHCAWATRDQSTRDSDARPQPAPWLHTGSGGARAFSTAPWTVDEVTKVQPLADAEQSSTPSLGDGPNFGRVQLPAPESQTALALLRASSRWTRLRSEAKKHRNSVRQMLHNSDWQSDWRVALKILLHQHELGRYLPAAPSTERAGEDGAGQRSSAKRRRPQKLAEHASATTRPSQVPIPTEATSEAFRKHVEHLVSLQPPRPVQRLQYRPDTPTKYPGADARQFEIQRQLEKLFRDEALRPLFSTEAFELAFQFLISHNMLSTARQLLNIMVESNTEVRTSTCNLFLRSAAQHNDLRFFTHFLRLQRSLDVPHDAHTWALFLKTLYSSKAKNLILDEMEKFGVLRDPVALRECVAEIIDRELSSLAKVGEPLTPLVERFDARFSPRWLSLKAANKICLLLGETGYIEQLPRMLALMQERECHPSSGTLAILLYQAYLMRDSQRALHLLKLFQGKRRGMYLKSKDQEVLFKLAWSTHGFNACHFLWRRACREGAVTKEMEHEVTQSLMRNVPAKPSTPHERWLKEAGKVIVLSPPRSALAMPDGYEIITDENRLPNTVARREQRKLARQMIQEEILNYAPGSFVGDWLPYYEMALQHDREWAEHDALSARPLDWKLVHVFRAPGDGTSKWRGRRRYRRLVTQRQAAHESTKPPTSPTEPNSETSGRTKLPGSKSETMPKFKTKPKPGPKISGAQAQARFKVRWVSGSADADTTPPSSAPGFWPRHVHGSA